MEKALAHLQGISNSLARLAALGAGEAESFDLNNAARSAVRESGIAASLELEEGVWLVHGGNPTFDSRSARFSKTHAKRATQSKDSGLTRSDTIASRIFLGVEDSGPGLQADIRSRTLDPLFSTKGERGRGIGLTLAAWLRRSRREFEMRTKK